MTHNGIEEMEALYTLCKQKKMHLGATIRPKRAPDELREENLETNLVIFVSSEKPIEDHIVMSDEVTESLATTAKFLLEELKRT